MEGKVLKNSRKKLGLTQVEASKRLGVSQTYLSLLENEKRMPSEQLVRMAIHKLRVSECALPIGGELKSAPVASDAQLVRELAALRYPGFGHVKPAKKKNPVLVLFTALRADDLESRLTEALPWVMLNNPEMEWARLVEVVKLHDLQNRLGFLTALTCELAKRKGDLDRAEEFAKKEQQLFKSKLAKQDTFCRERMSDLERKWLQSNRSSIAKRWNILSDLTAQKLSYG